MRKHEQLLKQIKLIDGLTQKLTTNKNELEKEIKDEYSRILENLKQILYIIKDEKKEKNYQF